MAMYVRLDPGLNGELDLHRHTLRRRSSIGNASVVGRSAILRPFPTPPDFPFRHRCRSDSVADTVVDAGHGRPILMLILNPRRRKSRRLARVRMRSRIGPTSSAVCGAFFSGLSRGIDPAGLDRLDFPWMAIIGVAEAIQLRFGFALRGLDHQRARHRPGNRRRVKAVIHQALGHVFNCHAGTAADPGCTREPRGHSGRGTAPGIVRQPAGDVIRVEDRHFGRLGESRRSHRRDLHPRNRQNAGAAPRRGRHGPAASLLAAEGWHHRVRGKNGPRCAATQMGPTPGPPPPCGMQNVLCRFRWQTSAPMIGGTANAHLGVHVRAVHVNLTAAIMDDPANLLDALLEHAVRRRIGHHQRRQIVLVRLRLAPRVLQINVALGVARHGTTRRPAMTALAGLVPCAEVGIRQTLALRLAPPMLVPGADHQQSGVFALAIRRWVAARRRRTR